MIKAIIFDCFGVLITESKNKWLLDLIKELKPKYKIGLLSNVRLGGLADYFNKKEVEEYFDSTVESGEIGYAKPEAQAYEIMADRLGTQLNQCVMIDDKVDFCQAATGVGMKAICYKTNEQLKSDLNTLLLK